MSIKNETKRTRHVHTGKGVYWLPKKYLEGKEQYQEVDIAISELTRLCGYLLSYFPDEVGKGEKGKDENAVDMTIRLLNKFRKEK